jgi:hypothetical protein
MTTAELKHILLQLMQAERTAKELLKEELGESHPILKGQCQSSRGLSDHVLGARLAFIVFAGVGCRCLPIPLCLRRPGFPYKEAADQRDQTGSGLLRHHRSLGLRLAMSRILTPGLSLSCFHGSFSSSSVRSDTAFCGCLGKNPVLFSVWVKIR